MIDSSHFFEFFVASTIIIIAPGPSVMFTIARGVAWGKWTAVLTTLGNSLGALVLCHGRTSAFFEPLDRIQPLLDFLADDGDRVGVVKRPAGTVLFDGGVHESGLEHA